MNVRDRRQRYWRAYEDSLQPPPGAAARSLAAIERRVVEVDTGGEWDEPASSEVPAGRAAAGMLLWLKSGAVSVGLAGAIVLSVKLAVVAWTSVAPPTTETTVTPSPATTSSEPPPRVRPRVDHVPATATTEVKPPPVAEPVVPTPSPAAVRVRGDDGKPSAPLTDRLRAELAVMERARRALAGDDPARLLDILDEHARTFPDGALREERLAWHAVAACRLGLADASTRAARFIREHPKSPQTSRVQSECVPVRRLK